MCQVLLFLMWGVVFADVPESDARRRLTNAPSGFELVGAGHCAVTEECSSYGSCWSSYFLRNTYKHRGSNTENCAKDARNAGARGFTVRSYNGSECWLHPMQNPGL